MDFYKCVSFECESGEKTLYFNNMGYEYDKRAEFFERNESIFNDEEYHVVLPSNLKGKIKLSYMAFSRVNVGENEKYLRLISAPFAEKEFIPDKNSKLSLDEQLSKALKDMPEVELLKKGNFDMKSFVEFSDAANRDFNPTKAEKFEIEHHNLLSIDKPIPNWCNRIMFYDIYSKSAKVQVNGKEFKINLSSKPKNCGYNFIGEVVEDLSRKNLGPDKDGIKIKTRDGKFVNCQQWEILYSHFILGGAIKEEARSFIL